MFSQVLLLFSIVAAIEEDSPEERGHGSRIVADMLVEVDDLRHGQLVRPRAGSPEVLGELAAERVGGPPRVKTCRWPTSSQEDTLGEDGDGSGYEGRWAPPLNGNRPCLPALTSTARSDP